MAKHGRGGQPAAKGGSAGGARGGPAKKPEGKLVTDSRFAAVHYDPRFQRFPKAKAKVEIDERFAGAGGGAGRGAGQGGAGKTGRGRGGVSQDAMPYFRR